jgi:hypothetical protein
MVTKSDLTSEEWDALKRLSQGSALMMGARILDRLEELGLVEPKLGGRGINEAGKILLRTGSVSPRSTLG